jgi:hypothetical protein
MRKTLTALLAALVGVSVAGLAGEPATAGSAIADVGGPKGDAVAARDVSRGIVSHRATAPAARRSVADYWTRERMLAAEPVPLPEVTMRQARRAAERAARVASLTEPVRIRGSAPVATSPSTRSASAAARKTSGERWNHPRTLIAKTAGRIFFKRGTKRYSCSGTTVSGRREDVISTAGSCVYLRGGWVKKFVFVPGYTNGRAPHGVYQAKRFFTTPQWRNDQKFGYNVAFVRMFRRDGRHVGARVGQQGTLFLTGNAPRASAFGFATNRRWTGDHLIYCRNDARRFSWSRPNYAMDCRMRGAASGGPWLRRFEGGKGRVFSVTGFIYRGRPAWLGGPWFGRAVYRAYQRAERPS